MTDRDQGVAAILFFLAGWVAPYVARFILPPYSRRHSAISGALVGAAIPGIAAVISFLAGINLPVPVILILLFTSALLGLISGLRGYVDAPRSYDGSRLTTISEPFYANLIDGQQPSDFDRENRKSTERTRGVGYVGGTTGGGSSGGGFSAGGGSFSGGGASGSW